MRAIRCFFLYCGILLLLVRCREQPPDPSEWYASVSARIEQSAGLQADTTHLEFLADSAFSHRTFIHRGHVFREEWYDRSGQLQGLSLFTPDGKFEWRREICPNGTTAFEGILFKNKFYGPCTWRYCNGQLRQQGVRFANREIGGWHRWDQNGAPVDTIQRGNEQLADSLTALLVPEK